MVQDTPNTYPQFTNLGLGEGLFDQLMTTVKHHLDIEYKDARIQSDKYADVYLGAMESVMQNSTQYLLGLLLIDQKKRGLELANAKAEFEIDTLLPLQASTMEAEIDKIRQEILNMQQEVLKMQAEVSLMNKQESKIDKEIEVMDKQMAKIDAEIILLGKQGELIDQQIAKLVKEIEYLTAKILTEQANTMANIAAEASLIGKQMSLLTAQRIGFAGNIQNTATKMRSDYDSLHQSVMEVEEQTQLSDPTLTQVSSAQSMATAIMNVDGSWSPPDPEPAP